MSLIFFKLMNFFYGLTFGISLLLALLLIDKAKTELASRRLFIYMISTAIVFLLMAINLSMPDLVPLWLKIIGGGTGFAALPALFFFYLLSLTGRDSKIYLLILVPFATQMLWHLIIYTQTQNYQRVSFVSGLMMVEPIYSWEIGFGLILMAIQLVFPVWGLSLIGQHQHSIQQRFSDIENIDLNWVKKLLWVILISLTVGVLLILSANFVALFEFSLAFVVLFTLVAIQVFYIGYYGISQTNLFTIADEIEPLNLSTLSKNVDKEELEKLKLYVVTSQIYKQNRLTIEQLSEACGLSVSTISSLINQGANVNFFDFINQYRVNEVIRQLQTPKNQQVSLINIALESGFNSKTSFNNVFKKLTGKTPSAYRNSILNLPENV